MRRVLPGMSVRLLALPVGAALVIGAVACTPAEDPVQSPGGTPSPTATATDAPPGLVPDGTAAENLPVFRQVTEQVWASDQRATGRAYVDALVAAGFDKAAMEVTFDQTSIGDPVDSLQVAVRWDDEDCLVGQVGPSVPTPAALVMPVLGDDRCLLGATRPIDW